MTGRILHFFDRLEDKVRAKLSHTPILYAFLGGIGVVLFWRGVWHLADNYDMSAIMSIIIGSVILLITGAFVTTFIGSRLITSGLLGEKKLMTKTKKEIETEETEIQKIQNSLDRVEEKITTLESEIKK